MSFANWESPRLFEPQGTTKVMASDPEHIVLLARWNSGKSVLKEGSPSWV